MSFGGLIEMTVGLALVYFLLSVFASGLNEIAESFVRRRSKYLEAGIIDLLGETTPAFYKHPLIQTLHPDQGRPRRVSRKGELPPAQDKQKPSYIPSRIFSATILSMLTNGRTTRRGPAAAVAAGTPASPSEHAGSPNATGASETTKSAVLSPSEAIDEIERNLPSLPNGQLKKSMGAFIDSSGRDYDELRAELERWYDDKMDRVSGWYRRRTKALLMVWGIGIAVFFNADSIVLAKTLYASSTLRAGLTAAVPTESRPADSPPIGGPGASTGPGGPGGPPSSPQPCPVPAARLRPSEAPSSSVSPTPSSAPGGHATSESPAAPSGSLQCVADQIGAIRALGLPLGWSPDGPSWPQEPHDMWIKALGWLITAAALTLGAPFWFDMFNKFVNVRATGQPPPKHGQPARATQPPPGIGESGMRDS